MHGTMILNFNYFLYVRKCRVRLLDNGIINALYASTGREACNFEQYYGSFIRLATPCNPHRTSNFRTSLLISACARKLLSNL